MTPQEENTKKENTPAPEFELEWLDDFAAEEKKPEEPKPAPEEKAEEKKPEEPKPAPEKQKVAAPVDAPKAETPETEEDAEEAARRRREKKKAAAQRRRMEEERRKKRRVSTLLMVICVIVAIGSAAMVIRAVYYYQNARNTYTNARENNVQTSGQAPVEDDPSVERTEFSGEQEDTRPEGADLEIDFAALKETNPEIVGWLHVPALDLSYPVMQAADNEYYLTHTLEDEYNPYGSIFMECTNLPDFSHGNTLLYGHNTTDGTMFGRLREFGENPSLRAEHPYFYVYQADGSIGRYKIYSYYSVYKDSDSFSWFTDDESYDYYVNMTKNLSLETIDADFGGRGNLVTLSTCFGASGTPYRFLVHGVRE